VLLIVNLGVINVNLVDFEACASKVNYYNNSYYCINSG